MPDASEQLGIDFDGVPQEHVHGAIPADPVALDEAIRAFYDQFPKADACMPDHGVHIFLDHRSRGPCVCKTANLPLPKGAP